jgi:hypothetical protein
MSEEIIVPLTDDEIAVLMIAAEGEALIDMGKYSKWSSPIQSLVKRGYLKQWDKFNNEITDAGRAALEGHGDAG